MKSPVFLNVKNGKFDPTETFVVDTTIQEDTIDQKTTVIFEKWIVWEEDGVKDLMFFERGRQIPDFWKSAKNTGEIEVFEI